MVTTVVLARHARTVWHAENRYTGSSDVPIDEEGQVQARTLAGWARRFAPETVYCSPMRRAVQTASPAAAALGVQLRTDDRLCEVDYGAAEGRTLAELRADDPEAVRGFEHDPVAGRFAGSEDPELAADRGLACVREVAAAHADGRLLVVTHNTLIRLMLCRVMGVRLREYRRLLPKVDSVALTRLRVGADHIALEGFNIPPCADGARLDGHETVRGAMEAVPDRVPRAPEPYTPPRRAR